MAAAEAPARTAAPTAAPAAPRWREQMELAARHWLVAELFSIGCFAFLGTAVRVLLVTLFQAADPWSRGPSSSYGIGGVDAFLEVFYAHPYLAANFLGCFIMGLLVEHPESLARRLSDPTLKGLRTGFCGCLTTFSAWLNSSVRDVFGPTWFEIFVMLFMEFWLTWGAFCLGLAAARTVRDGWSALATHVPPSLKPPRQQELQLAEYRQLEPADALELAVSGSDASAVVSPTKPAGTEPVLSEFALWTALFVAMASTVWIALIVLDARRESLSPRQRLLLRSVALAPLGAWMRWALSRTSWLCQTWPLLHLQTFTANMVAVLIMCCLLTFAPHHPWTDPIDAGFNGSCSTVSTFFNEIHNLHKTKGPAIAARYSLATFIGAIFFIQIVRLGQTANH